jgi:hypothetical protein
MELFFSTFHAYLELLLWMGQAAFRLTLSTHSDTERHTVRGRAVVYVEECEDSYRHELRVRGLYCRRYFMAV